MIVHNLDISCAIFGPAKNDTPLGVNTNAVKAFKLSLQRLKPVSRRRAQVSKDLCSIQNVELIKRELVDLARGLSGMTAGYAVE